MKNKFSLSLISFLAALAGVIISFLLLKEDILSTAHMVFEYFPARFGVVPSSTWDGAIVLGLFTSVLQIISASILFSDKFDIKTRSVAAVTFVLSMVFDNWTDIIFRSQNGTGDILVATITTIAFYTGGSELTQGLSWIIIFTTWRLAISDFMWGWARMLAGFGSIKGEWAHFKSAAQNKESFRPVEKPKYQPQYRPVSGHQFPKDSLMRQGEQQKLISPIFSNQYTQKIKDKRN